LTTHQQMAAINPLDQIDAVHDPLQLLIDDSSPARSPFPNPGLTRALGQVVNHETTAPKHLLTHRRIVAEHMPTPLQQAPRWADQMVNRLSDTEIANLKSEFNDKLVPDIVASDCTGANAQWFAISALWHALATKNVSWGFPRSVSDARCAIRQYDQPPGRAPKTAGMAPDRDCKDCQS